MFQRFVSRRHLLLYGIAIMITWLEAVISPAMVQLIVSSFTDHHLDLLWLVLVLGIGGNLILLLGLAGKRYFYARIITDFKRGMKRAIFHSYLKGAMPRGEDVLSDLEKDVPQLEVSYVEPTLIICSSLGFTLVSIAYALWNNFYLGLLFIVFYSIPVLCSGIGAKSLDRITSQKAAANQSYMSQVTNMIAGHRQIRQYQAQQLFEDRFAKELDQTLSQEVAYEKQRTLNGIVINTINALCSVAPIVIGGIMTYYGYLTAAAFVGVYLVSYNIGYQFQELAYYVNTRKSVSDLHDRYQELLSQKEEKNDASVPALFPIQGKQVLVKAGERILCGPCGFKIEEGEKVAIIGESGAGKTTLLNLLFGEIEPDSGQVLYAGKSLTRQAIQGAGAYILQSSHYFDGLSLEENIALSDEVDADKVNRVIQVTGLATLKDGAPSNQTLSGGEKQRLEIARALYQGRSFILADEIKANLDTANAHKITELLFSLPQTVIEVIHHYQPEDLERYDQVICLKKEDR